jgi:hypothetical protein
MGEEVGEEAQERRRESPRRLERNRREEGTGYRLHLKGIEKGLPYPFKYRVSQIHQGETKRLRRGEPV